MVGLTLPFVVLPFGESVIVADLNGACSTCPPPALYRGRHLGVGWASNSKWSLFGAVRGAAQVVSYESSRIAIMVPVMMAGTLSMQESSAPRAAALAVVCLPEPGRLVAFFIAMTASLAEGNRHALRSARG